MPDDLSVEVASGIDCDIRVSSRNGLVCELHFGNYLSLGQLHLQNKNIASAKKMVHQSSIGLAVLWAYGQGLDLSKGFDISVRRESESVDHVFIGEKDSHYGSHYMVVVDEKRGVVRGDAGE